MATTTLTVTRGAWVDLGPAPFRLFVREARDAAVLVFSDTAPTDINAPGINVPGLYWQGFPVNGKAAHVWARALVSQITADVVSASTGSGVGSPSVSTDKTTVSGTGVKGSSTVTVYKNGSQAGTATANTSGAWSYVFSTALQSGDIITYDGVLTSPPVTVAPVALAISGAPGAAVVGKAYTFTPSVTGGSGTRTFALSAGTLPSGLTLAPSTGAIAGTPTAAGTANGIALTVTDSTGSATLAGLSIAVAAAPAIKGVLFKGDSLTAGYYASDSSKASPAVFSALTGVSSINNGVVGQYLDDMAAKYSTADAPSYSATTANALVLEGGINDIKGGKTLSQLQTAVQSYVSQAKSTGFSPIMVSTITATNVSGWTSGMETIRTGYNSWLRANFASFADKLSDKAADSRFADPTNTTYFNADMLHYTDAGYAAQADIDRLALGVALAGPATTYTTTASASPTVGAPTTITIRASGNLNSAVTISVAASPDGALSASSVTLPAGVSPSATLTYTPATAGTKTLTTTNNGGLANPAALSLTAVAVSIPTFSTTAQSGPVALTNSNRTATLGNASVSNASAGLSGAALTGKKFFAATLTTFVNNGYVAFGLTTQAVGTNTAIGFGSSAGESGIGLYQGGAVYAAGSSIPGTFPTVAQGDTIGILTDATNTMLWITKDGTNFYGANGTVYTAAQVAAGTGGIVAANVFGKGALGGVGIFSGSVGSQFTLIAWPSAWAVPSGFSSM